MILQSEPPSPSPTRQHPKSIQRHQSDLGMQMKKRVTYSSPCLADQGKRPYFYDVITNASTTIRPSILKNSHAGPSYNETTPHSRSQRTPLSEPRNLISIDRLTHQPTPATGASSRGRIQPSLPESVALLITPCVTLPSSVSSSQLETSRTAYGGDEDDDVFAINMSASTQSLPSTEHSLL